MSALGVGARLEPVLVGPPVDGTVATWRGSDRRFWMLADPAQVALIGTGVLARTQREPLRFREVVMSADDGFGLLAVERASVDAGGAAEAGAVRLDAREVEQPDVTATSDAVWDAVARWLTGVVKSAAGRGEFVVVERGGWEFQDEPYALAFPQSGDDGGVMHIERAPGTPQASMWPSGGDPRGQSISAPLTQEHVDVVGLLLIDAARTWASSPHDLGITFARPPSPSAA